CLSVRSRRSTFTLCLSFAYLLSFLSFFFFFQAEDGIRDRNVTGVQTCALPIFEQSIDVLLLAYRSWAIFKMIVIVAPNTVKYTRSEERRVGKECRSRWWPEH